jgi:hypothetical protein
LTAAIWTAPGLYFDNPPHTLNAIVLLEIYRLIHNPTKNADKSSTYIMMLSSLSFLIKPITALSLIFCFMTTSYILLKYHKRNILTWIKVYMPALLAGCTWVARNIILSGYPLYPLPVLALNLDWAMTAQHVQNNFNDIIAWARMPGPYYLESLKHGFVFWFKPWLASKLKYVGFWLFITLPFVFSLFLWVKTLINCCSKEKILFFMWSFLSILYWFLSSPDFRFAFGFFATFFALSILFYIPLNSAPPLTWLFSSSKIRLASLIICGVIILLDIGLNMIRPMHSLIYIGTIPSLSVKEYIIRSASSPSFAVWIPANEGEDRCGNSPIPSSPYYVKVLNNLDMRAPGNFGKGFRPIKRDFQ